MIPYETRESEFPLTPEGTHPAIISEVEIYNNPNGTDKLIVKFDYQDSEGEVKKHSEFVTPAIMEGDGFRVFADLISITNPDGLPPAGEYDEQSLVGTECMITVKHTKGKGNHEGKTFANLVKVEAPAEEEPKKKA